MKKIRVLSLDGGGIRGIIPASVLEYVENQLIKRTNNSNARLADYFDMVVGTSTGGILGCYYLTPNITEETNQPSAKYTASKALDFYSEKGYAIFNASRQYSWLGLRQLFNATGYSANSLEEIFHDEFGELKMSELLKPCIVTTYDLIRKSSFFFYSREETDKKRDFLLKDVARSTSAAPTYFPPVTIKNIITGEKMINIDGGVFANNPVLCAYAECRKSKFSQVDYPTAKDMLILSIGTGGGQFKLPDVRSSNHWGIVNWAKSIPEIMMDGSIDTVDFQMKKLFETLEKEHQQNYKRIDVPLDKRKYSGNMADASRDNIQALMDAGKAALEDALTEKDGEMDLDSFINELIKNKP